MGNKKITDPASKADDKKNKKNIEDLEKSFDINNLSMADFQQLSEASARTPGPFQGYPLGYDVIIGKDKDDKEVKVSSTFIVGLNPQMYVAQDPSGKKVTVVTDKRDGNGKKTGGKVDKIVSIETCHSRMVPNWEEGYNEDFIFDRELRLKDGVIKIAIVKSHSARAQLCYKVNDQTQKITVDRNYVLLDAKQVSKLRKVFEILINPHLKIERIAAAVTGESSEELDSLPKTALEE